MWQTRTEFFRETERALFEDAPLDGRARVVEVGCGEGGNLVNLFGRAQRQPALVVGVDLFREKLRFAAEQVSGARFVCGDAARLPLASEAFDLVICRDVLHHVETPDNVLAEMRRVCAPGGSVIVIEPNGRNPLMRAFGRLIAAERVILDNSPASVAAAVGRHFASPRLIMKQPLPVFRAIFHYQYGCPWLERVPPVAWAMRWLNRIAAQAVAQDRWAYIVVLSKKT